MNRKFALLILLSLLYKFDYSQLYFGFKNKFSKADSLRGNLTELRTCYDVLKYDLDIKVDIENKFISGSNTIKFLVTKDFQKFQIDLFENMKIEKIEFNSIALTFTRLYNAVFVAFPDTLRKENMSSITVYYSGNPQVAKNPPWDGGFTWNKDKDGTPFVGVSCQGTGASLWWPCKEHQSDEPNEMLIRVTVPKGLDEVSNGRLKRKTSVDEHWDKFEWYVSYPINNYDVTVNITKYKHFNDWYFNKSMSTDTLTLDYFVLEQNFEKAKKQFAQVKSMMDAYYTYFGEYPFIRDGYKLVEAPYLGMEHQSCVEYGNKYKNGYLGYDRSSTGYQFDYIIIHESAHEWWGNCVTTRDIADMWIHEGFGTYAEALYIEYLFGRNAYLDYINSEKKSVSNDSPIIGKYNVNNEGSGDMYPKGALLLHTIRSCIDNDKLFFEILHGIQTEFRYQTITSKIIENFISEKSGIDFSSVFDLYLRKNEIPVLYVHLYKDFLDLKADYYFRFMNKRTEEFDEAIEKTNFTMPVKVTTEKNVYNVIFPSSGRTQAINLQDMKKEDFKVADNLFYIDVKIIDED